MAVIDLRRGGETQQLGEGLGSILSGVYNLITKDARQQDQLRTALTANPEAGRLARTQILEYITSNPGQIDPKELPLSEIGMTDELAHDLLELYPLTSEEQAERRLREDPDFTKDLVTQAKEGLKAEIETSRTTRLEQGLRGETAEILGSLDFPALQAAAMARTAEAEGLSAAEAIQHYGLYQDQLENLSPKDRMLAGTFARNPGTAQYIVSLEQREWEEGLAVAAAEQDAQKLAFDLLDAEIKINKEAERLVEEIRTAIDEGDRDLLPGLMAKLNHLGETQLAFFPSSAALTAQGVRRLFREELKDLDFGVLTFMDQTEMKIEDAAQLIASEEGTREQLLRTEDFDRSLIPLIMQRAEEIRSGREASNSDRVQEAASLMNLDPEVRQRRLDEVKARLEDPNVPARARGALLIELRLLQMSIFMERRTLSGFTPGA